MKKLIAPVLVFGGAVSSAFAQTNFVMNVEHTQQAITAVETGMKTILDKLAPAVIGVILAGVAIWAIPRILGTLRTAFSSGKGR